MKRQDPHDRQSQSRARLMPSDHCTDTGHPCVGRSSQPTEAHFGEPTSESPQQLFHMGTGLAEYSGASPLSVTTLQ